jgi:predicted dehydrogenase
MSEQDLRLGIIGCGALGVIHARRFDGMPGVTVTALSDPNEEGMARAAETLRNPNVLRTTDYRELLDSGLDAVCIASPDRFHVPQVMDALAANLHVLCEKPLTPDPEDLQAVIDSMEEVEKHVALTYPRRYDMGIRRMREEILSSRWGRVTSITAYNAEDWITPNRGTWRHDPAICPGGMFYDASGHQLDSLMWVTGLRGDRVWAETDNRSTPNVMFSRGHATLTGGVPLTFTFVGDAHKWREQINIHCEGADFVIENGRAFMTVANTLEPLASPGEAETADEAFVKLIRGEGINWAPPIDVWPVLTFTNAALESARTGEEREVSTQGYTG